MARLSRKEASTLFLGDIISLLVSLWLTLLIRYGTLPDWEIFQSHLIPFSFLFVVWIAVFFIAGVYEKQTVILKRRIWNILLNAEIVNAIIAIIFFYFIPYFGITPKTNLFIYLIVSFGAVLLWRTWSPAVIGAGRKQNAILIGSGEEVKELLEEVNENFRYNIRFVSVLDLPEPENENSYKNLLQIFSKERVEVIVLNLHDKRLESADPYLYQMIFSNVQFADFHKLYEDIFDRIPISLLSYRWFLENTSFAPKTAYDIMKRGMDVIISLFIGFISLFFYPFVFLAIKAEDGGPIFGYQDRIGKGGKIIRICKFRSMQRMDNGKKEENRTNPVTKVGAFIRKFHIDELPQLWNVFRGDISLIGPRPELPSLASLYEKEIPYYNIRHLIKPGLSGWAQIYHDSPPKFGQAVDKTKAKLAYDLFYIKNRSLAIDIKVALRTIKELISKRGV